MVPGGLFECEEPGVRRASAAGPSAWRTQKAWFSSGWALAIPMYGHWVGGGEVVPTQYPPTAPPWVYPSPYQRRYARTPAPSPVRQPSTVTTRTAHMTLLGRPKEILGVDNALGTSGHAEAVSATGSHLTPLLFGPPCAPAPGLKSLIRPQVINPASSH